MILARRPHRCRPRRHLHPLRRARRDHERAGRRRQPRHRGLHALRRAAAPTPSPPRRGNPWIGALAGAIAGGMLASVHAYFVINRKSNQLATGLIVLFLGLGITSLFGPSYVKAEHQLLRVGRHPRAVEHPLDRRDLLRPGPAHLPRPTLLVPALWWFIFRSRWGVLLRAAGERSEVLTTYGHNAGAASATRRSSPAACSPASAAPSSRSPTPTPGSRTWSRAGASSPWRS